jgi:hypothetical protein
MLLSCIIKQNKPRACDECGYSYIFLKFVAGTQARYQLQIPAAYPLGRKFLFLLCNRLGGTLNRSELLEKCTSSWSAAPPSLTYFTYLLTYLLYLLTLLTSLTFCISLALLTVLLHLLYLRTYLRTYVLILRNYFTYLITYFTYFTYFTYCLTSFTLLTHLCINYLLSFILTCLLTHSLTHSLTYLLNYLPT